MIEVAQSTCKIDLPDGEYSGLWSGWYIQIFIPTCSSVDFKAHKCMHPEKPVNIVVSNGVAYAYNDNDI